MQTELACPICAMTELAKAPEGFECLTCGHEFAPQGTDETQREVRDAYGNLLANGDTVALIKDLKVKGSSKTVKVGTKVRGIRLIDGDHEIDCKVEGFPILLKAEFVKKA
jgi:protein PhnA